MKLIHSTMGRFLIEGECASESMGYFRYQVFIGLKSRIIFHTITSSHRFFFQSKKHPVLSRTIVEHWKYGLFGIPCNTSDTKRNIISNNIIFVLVNAWYLFVRWMHVINHLYVCSADWACHMSLCSLHHSGIQFSFLYWTVIIIPLLPSLQRRWRGDCVKEYRVVQSVSPQDTVFRTQPSKTATLYHKAAYINFS